MADVVIAGAAGRMGSRLVSLLQDEKDLRLVAALEAPGHLSLLKDAGEVAGIGRLDVAITAEPGSLLTRDRVLVEFTTPQATLAFGVVTSGISQVVHPRFTTCSSQKSFAMFPAP